MSGTTTAIIAGEIEQLVVFQAKVNFIQILSSLLLGIPDRKENHFKTNLISTYICKKKKKKKNDDDDHA